VQGRGAAKVISIGAATEMGKIGKTLGKITEERTLLQKETGRIVRNFSIAGAILCLLIVVIYGLTRGNWIQGVLSGLTLSMAMLPEEFPVVLIIFLTLGAWRMSRHRVLTRRAAVVETLGAATVLCTDKTGTLTLNSMKLSGLFTPLEKVADKDDGFQPGVLPSSADMPPSRPVRKEFYNEVKEHSSLTGFTRGRYWELDTHQDDLPEEFHNIVEYSILASQRDPFDPIEKEIHRVGETYLRGTEHIHNNWQLVHEYVLSKQLLALSHVWESPDKQNYIIAAKGAPESIIDLCHIDAAARVALGDKITLMADKGLRVLGVAKAIFAKGELPKNQHDFDFEFIGFIGMVDPVRKIVPNSVQEAYNAGVRVIMITGDYPGTAQHIARQIGLRNPEKYITGPEMEALDFLALRERIKEANIFARVVPEQKLAIVNALKANGEVVAMTGDGVNDAPALKAAHIGVAMGERGTDVAREASAIVLLNDDFSSIVQAIRLGRRIFDNLKKAIAYIFSVHIPIAGMSFLPVVFNLPLVLLPAHIAFLELIIDPACSTVFESVPEEKDIMNRPPRNLSEPLFSRKTLIFSLLQGLSVLAVVFIVFLLALRRGMGEIEARTLSFAALTFANILLIITNLSWKQSLGHILRSRNLALWWVCSGTLAALLAVIYVPFLRGLFHFAPLSLGELAIAFFAGIASLGWFEGLKLLGRNR
jgi:Ca2+-transporting ATPase